SPGPAKPVSKSGFPSIAPNLPHHERRSPVSTPACGPRRTRAVCLRFLARMLRDIFAHGVWLARQICREGLAVSFVLLCTLQLVPAATATRIIVRSEPLHSGRISPELFGNFVELLDDVVPGLWAEMLNDRAFAGVTQCLHSFYYDGVPNFCDREWDANSS